MMKSINKYIPSSIKNFIKLYILKYRISYSQKNYKEKIKGLSKQKKIKVAFLIENESIWKYERLYFLLKEDSLFDPVVFICPFFPHGMKIMKEEMNNIYLSFISKDYDVVKTLKEDGTYYDIKKEFQPDIVFFSTFWAHTKPQYLIYNFLDVLTCLVPYGFYTTEQFYFTNEPTLLCWKFFVETTSHKEAAKRLSLYKGENFVVSGFPGIDTLIDRKYKANDVWKRQEESKKKVIWAPHHSIKGVAGRHIFLSTFLSYADFMLKIADKYKDKLQISFKPHPNLKGKLNEIWGEEKTNKYYATWNNIPNGQLDEGDYMDLFLTSDAMIHDSGSFLIEYLYTFKPVLFLDDGVNLEDFNPIGVEALNSMEKGYSKDDIIRFIEEVVIGNNDQFKLIRNEFIEQNLMPPNSKLASENIYNHIKEEIS